MQITCPLENSIQFSNITPEDWSDLIDAMEMLVFNDDKPTIMISGITNDHVRAYTSRLISTE